MDCNTTLFRCLLVLQLALSGCVSEFGSEDEVVVLPTADVGSRVSVRLGYDAQGARIRDVRESTGDVLTSALSTETDVVYTFRNSNGVVLDTGFLANPFEVQSEFAEDGTPDPLTIRVAEGAVTLDLPNQDGELTIVDHGVTPPRVLGTVVLSRLTEQQLARSSQALSTREEVVAPATMIGGGGGEIRILLLPDGFTEAELPEFQEVAAEWTEALRTTSGYDAIWDDLTILRQDVISRQSGVDDPENEIEVDTAFDVGRNLEIRRAMMIGTSEGFEFASTLREEARANVVSIISNDEEWGGAAGSWLNVNARHPFGAVILAHELGHSLFGLSDEYDNNDGQSCPETARYVGHNVSASLTALPWQDMLETPILPTPATDDFMSVVGAFEGAQHCESYFRPQHNCMMRGAGTGFCDVCMREIRRIAAENGTRPGTPSDIVAELPTPGSIAISWRQSDEGRTDHFDVFRNGRRVAEGNFESYRDEDPPTGLVRYELFSVAPSGARSWPITIEWDFDDSTTETVPAPANLRAAVYGKRNLELFWDRAAGAVRYEISRDGSVVGERDGLSLYENGLEPGTEYAYQVVSISNTGERSEPASITVTTEGTSETEGSEGGGGEGGSGGDAETGDDAPQNLRASVYSRRSLELFWDRLSGSHRYQVSRDGVPVGETDGVSFFETGLESGTEYVYEVRRMGSGGALSSPARFTVRTR